MLTSIAAEHVYIEDHLPALEGLEPVQCHHGAAHVGEVEGIVAPEHVDRHHRAQEVEHADQRHHVPNGRKACGGGAASGQGEKYRDPR